MKDLLGLSGVPAKEIAKFIDLGLEIKARPQKYSATLNQKTLAMIFQKTSTRTRVSFEAAMTQLGGHAQYLDWRATNFTLGSIKDEVKCLERYVDVIMARVYKHEDVAAMGEAARTPVINGLCNLEHPCQALADLMTIKEKFGDLKGLKIAYVGDGNNVCNSLILGAAKTGMKIAVATPKGYEPAEFAVKEGLDSGSLELTNDAKSAVKGAKIVYTDTWTSMGQEQEQEARKKVFPPYQVNAGLISLSDNAYFMHCLPAHRGMEVTDEVLDSENSIVYDQAENRLHIQKAILVRLLQKD